MPNEAKNATMDNVNLNAGVTNSFVVGIVLIKMTIPIVGLAGMMYIPPSPSSRDRFIYSWLTKRSVPKKAKNATMDTASAKRTIATENVQTSNPIMITAGVAKIRCVESNPTFPS